MHRNAPFPAKIFKLFQRMGSQIGDGAASPLDFSSEIASAHLRSCEECRRHSIRTSLRVHLFQRQLEPINERY